MPQNDAACIIANAKICAAVARCAGMQAENALRASFGNGPVFDQRYFEEQASIMEDAAKDLIAAGTKGGSVTKELAEIYAEIMEQRDLQPCWFIGIDPDAYGDCFQNPGCPDDCPLERLRKLAKVEAKP